MKMKTIEQIMKEIVIVPETELTKEYNAKSQNGNESIESKLKMVDRNFGEHISSPSITSSDFTDRYGLVLFNLCHDPDHRGGLKGCAYTSQLQVIDLASLDRLLLETYNYRGTGNSPFNHRINFSEGKILQERGSKIIFGIKSHELLEFYEFDVEKKEQTLLESVDLGEISKNREKLEKADRAFKELDTEAISDFLRETGYFTSVKKLSEDYALVIQQDPYGDTGSRHAKTKLVIKGKGIVDLQTHSKKFPGRCVTQGFDLENAQIKYDGNRLTLHYDLRERESGHTQGDGRYFENHLGTTSHTIDLTVTDLELPIGRDLKLDHLIDQEKTNLLSPGNISKIPIAMYGFRRESPINYAYSIDRIEKGGKTYLLVSKIIDMEHYDGNGSGILAVEQQLNVQLYEVMGLDGKTPQIKPITGITTDTNDRKRYALKVKYDNRRDEMTIIKPKINVIEQEVVVNYDVRGDGFDEKEIRLKI